MVRLSAGSQTELDALTTFVENEFEARRLPLTRIRRKSRQEAALLSSMGILISV
jgi:hypothetical protein